MIKKTTTNLVLLSLMFTLGSSVTSCKKTELPEQKKEINAEEEERQRQEEELRKQEEERKKQEEELRKQEEELRKQEEDLYNKYITPELKEGLEALGMEINRGITPPMIEGYYLLAEPRCIATTTGTVKELEVVFDDQHLAFQNQESLSVDYARHEIWEEQVYSTSSGKGNFITGEGNLFTIIIEAEGESVNQEDGKTYNIVTTEIYSGEIVRDEEGKITEIKDLLFVFLMKDNGGAPRVIPNGTGRLFKPTSGSATAMSKAHYDEYINALSNTLDRNSVEAISIFSIAK